ncbi:hypothetical protein ACQ4M3_13190 [Leptolyngbya sp. AN03gr2]|uniref:hypothetical protein n=1 Tax=unclassified Leptolyngbya TaxID=2650499 RepID=UPI003D317889
MTTQINYVPLPEELHAALEWAVECGLIDQDDAIAAYRNQMTYEQSEDILSILDDQHYPTAALKKLWDYFEQLNSRLSEQRD